MKERAIIFSGEMVRAILDGRKTQTRRVIKPPKGSAPEYAGVDFGCPHGAPGDRLWVRENIRWYKEGSPTRYAADGCPVMRDGESVAWTFNEAHVPSIHMPRWASRITLEITDVRVERLQDMSFVDWVADFCPSSIQEECALQTLTGSKNQTDVARHYWDSLNANRGFGWDTNPWVWVISFKRIEEGRTP